MTRPALRWTVVCGLAASFLGVSSVSIPAQEKKDPPKVIQRKANPSAERASGVITKAEPIAQGGMRLTINTAAVWRDWARDQAPADPNLPPRKAAERGANSIATKGEPQTKDTLVVINLRPETKLETRFRSMNDETTKGASTPAAAQEGAAGSKDASRGSRTQTAKPTQYKTSDLKPGLFIEADFRRAGGDNLVSTVTVIRPVSESASTEKPAGK
jgi:hypothetical protein